MFFDKQAKLRLFFLILFVAVVLGMFISYSAINEKGYNSIMMEYISAKVVNGGTGFEDKIRTLRNFVHENVHPVSGEDNRLYTVGIDKLTSGVGWCDQISRVFMQLARGQGITTRLLFLQNKEGSSPHSIAEAWDGKRWVLVDAAYNMEFNNSKGQMASMADVKESFDIVLENPRIKEFASHNSWWADKEHLTMYYRTPQNVTTKRASQFRLMRFFPLALNKFFACVAQDMYIFKKRKDFSSRNDYLYFKARNYQLAGRANSAKKIYNKILESKNAGPLKGKALFFLALLLRDEGHREQAIEVLNELIGRGRGSGWWPYGHGLRSQLYKSLGDNKASESDLAEIAGSVDAYF